MCEKRSTKVLPSKHTIEKEKIENGSLLLPSLIFDSSSTLNLNLPTTRLAGAAVLKAAEL